MPHRVIRSRGWAGSLGFCPAELGCVTLSQRVPQSKRAVRSRFSPAELGCVTYAGVGCGALIRLVSAFARRAGLYHPQRDRRTTVCRICLGVRPPSWGCVTLSHGVPHSSRFSPAELGYVTVWLRVGSELVVSRHGFCAVELSTVHCKSWSGLCERCLGIGRRCDRSQHEYGGGPVLVVHSSAAIAAHRC